MSDVIGYKVDKTANTISYNEYELVKTKEGVDTRLKKTHTKSIPPLLSDNELEVLIETFIYSFLSSPKVHDHNLLSALLELKDRRGQTNE